MQIAKLVNWRPTVERSSLPMRNDSRAGVAQRCIARLPQAFVVLMRIGVNTLAALAHT
jgi:hypothetical protein